MKKFFSLLLMALLTINANAAGDAADWYLYLYSTTFGVNGSAGQFKTTDTDGVFVLEEVVIPGSGISFCINNNSWSSIYGWGDGGTVNAVGTPFALAASSNANGWMELEAGTYDVTWNANDLTIQFDEHVSQVASDWYLYFYSEELGLNGDAGRFEQSEIEGVYAIKNLQITASGFSFCIHNEAWTTRYGYTETYPATVSETGTAVPMMVTSEGTNGWLAVPEGIYNVTLDMRSSEYITIQFDANVYPAYIVVYASRDGSDVLVGTIPTTSQAFGTYAGQLFMNANWENFWIYAVDDNGDWTAMGTNESNGIVSDEGAWNFWTNSGNAGIYDFSFDFAKSTYAWTCTYNEEASTHKLTIDENGYATFYSDFAYIVPEGLTGYIVTAIGDGALTLTETYPAGTQVPRWTGILFKGDAGEYTFTFNGDLSEINTDNLLSGTQTEQDTPSWGEGYYYYKFANGEEGLGWYWGAPDGGVFTNGANKAYLVVKQDYAGVRSFIPFFDDETGIEATQNSKFKIQNEIYDLSGRKVLNGKMSNGIYILNGKKYIIK